MPAKSEAQRRLMEMCAHGGKCPPGMTPEEARKFLGHGSKKPAKKR